MITIEQALTIIKAFLLNREFHQDYERTVELSVLYRQLITGIDIDDLMIQFNPRESAELFEQRKNITKHITPAIANNIMNPFYKVTKSQRVTKKFEIEKNNNTSEITDRIRDFFPSDGAQNGLDSWIQSRFIELTFCDPNAFVVIEFPAFDNKKVKPTPRPFEVACEDVVDFDYDRAKLSYLMVKHDWVLQEKSGENKAAINVTLYGEDFTIRFVEIAEMPAKAKATDKKFYWSTNDTISLPEGEKADENKGLYFEVTVYNSKTKGVPAFRVGYKRDLATDGRTFVNPFHPGLCYFEKSIKLVSEFDLTNALHVFPQKLQYVQKCNGDGNKECNGGKTLDNKVCQKCGGSGTIMHVTAQDVITMPMPESKEDMVPLKDIMLYLSPPIELLEFQNKIVDSISTKVHQAVFNSTVLLEKKIVKTATEQSDDMESAYDTLEPFGKKISQVWMQIVRTIIVLTDNKEKALLHRYPADFKLKTKEQLYAEIKMLNDSGAPSFVVEAVTEDLASLIYVDDAEMLLKYKVKRKFDPFPGKTPDEIAMLMVQDFTEKRLKVLFANFNYIFNIIERTDKDFYVKSTEVQKKAIDKELDEIIKLIPEEVVATRPNLDPNAE